MKCHFAMWSLLGLGALAVGPGCDKKEGNAGGGSGCTHGIKKDKCPFCTPSLIDAEGSCGEHGVPEALCYQCRPYLKAAFRAKGDWCSKHNAPDSQCITCHPELASKAKPGSGHGDRPSGTESSDASGCPHKIDRAKCPFCNPGLVQSEGFCKEHDVAEALCHRCRPYLKAAFQAKGDWCKEHDVPESQCLLCNPNLKKGKPSQP